LYGALLAAPKHGASIDPEWVNGERWLAGVFRSDELEGRKRIKEITKATNDI
jgi:hypothetical protein